ncbi:hypothetical protein Tco_0238120 [Tanacetum coccineum]
MLHPRLHPLEFRSTIGPHVWPYRSSYETPSPSSPLTLPIRKRYRGTSELILDIETKDESSDSDAEREGHGLEDEVHGLDDEGHGLEDEGPGSEEEEAAPEGQQQAVSVVDTAVSKPLGLGYGALRRRELALGEGSTPPSPEWSSGSLLVSPSSPVVLSRIASLVITPAATISVNEDQFLERYRFRSLEREQKRATMTFSAIWRPVLALEAWAGQTDAQRAAIWHAIYDNQRENHDLRRQIAKERRERLELTDHVARMERR